MPSSESLVTLTLQPGPTKSRPEPSEAVRMPPGRRLDQ